MCGAPRGIANTSIEPTCLCAWRCEIAVYKIYNLYIISREWIAVERREVKWKKKCACDGCFSPHKT